MYWLSGSESRPISSALSSCGVELALVWAGCCWWGPFLAVILPLFVVALYETAVAVLVAQPSSSLAQPHIRVLV